MEYDYQVIGKDGKLHNYIWDDKQSKMVEGKREKIIPWCNCIKSQKIWMANLKSTSNKIVVVMLNIKL